MKGQLLGLAGLIGSGKDTVADILVRDHGFVKISFADVMKRQCKIVYAFTDEQLWGPSSARNAPDKRYPRDHTHTRDFFSDRPESCACCNAKWSFEGNEPQCYLTPRYALQLLGTEWGRHCYANTWVDCTLRVASTLLIGDKYRRESYTAQRGLFDRGEDEGDHADCINGVVISDVRFHNEVKAIREAGGILWKTTHGSGLSGAAGTHSSESHIDSLEVDAVVPDQVDVKTLPMIVTTMLKETLR